MLPGKIFLESIRPQTQRSTASKLTYKLNLIINQIYYDELKQFHTKYLCVNSTDVLTLELFTVESHQLLGITSISDLYKHMLDNRTVDVKIKSNNILENDLIIKLSFQAVSTFNRRRSTSGTKRVDDATVRSPPKDKEKEQTVNPTDMPFNHSRGNFNDTLGNTSRSSFQATSIVPIQNTIIRQGEGDSLQSLAQQRQKILGELFGKFKRQK